MGQPLAADARPQKLALSQTKALGNGNIASPEVNPT
jgi:hypothetical protein